MMNKLQRRTAVLAAVGGMWILGVLGIFLVIRTGHVFILPSADRSATIAQIAGFYIAFFGAKIPATAFVAFIICRSDFLHPARVAALITVCCELLRFAIHLVRWPWFAVSNVAWWVPAAFDLAGIASLTLLVLGFTWLIRRANNSVEPTRALSGTRGSP
jgi:hypothetical protein